MAYFELLSRYLLWWTQETTNNHSQARKSFANIQTRNIQNKGKTLPLGPTLLEVVTDLSA
jgi:hypothetical protein